MAGISGNYNWSPDNSDHERCSSVNTDYENRVLTELCAVPPQQSGSRSPSPLRGAGSSRSATFHFEDPFGNTPLRRSRSRSPSPHRGAGRSASPTSQLQAPFRNTPLRQSRSGSPSPNRLAGRSRSPSPNRRAGRSRSPSPNRLAGRSRSPSPQFQAPFRQPPVRQANPGSADDGSDSGDEDGRATSMSSSSSSSSSSRSRLSANAGRAARLNARQARRQRRLAEGGLNAGERPTPGRLRNPSKYTDKSMRTNLDRSDDVGNARRRIADGLPTRELNAICTNRLGKVRLCKQLLTPMNFRRLYLRLDDKLPRNLILALTLDVSDNRLRTLDAAEVTTYYYNAAAYLRASISSADDELLDSDLAVKWLMNAIQILESLNLCVGEKSVAEVLDEKYIRYLELRPGTLAAAVMRTLPQMDIHNADEALEGLQRLAKVIKPTDMRIWGMDNGQLSEIPNLHTHNPNVFLGEARANELRAYPLGERLSRVDNVEL